MINKQGNNHGLNAWSPPLEIMKQWIICNFTTFFLGRPIAQFIFFPLFDNKPHHYDIPLFFWTRFSFLFF